MYIYSNWLCVMIEKIEITQRFNFKKLNRHYECFIIDFINRIAYFKINERFHDDKFIEESCNCNNSWISIFTDLKSRVTTKIHHLDDNQIDCFQSEYDDLNLFCGFESQDYLYFEKLETVYSCNINIYHTDKYEEYSIKNNFPENWIKFNQLLMKLVNFDLLNINHLQNIITGLFHNIQKNAIYDKSNNKLKLTSIEFGHYENTPYTIPKPSIIIDIEQKTIKGYLEKENFNTDIILHLLEKYGVYKWICKSYQMKSQNHDSNILEGYNWYLELVFNNSIIYNIQGYNEYPDTYPALALEIEKLTGLDLLERQSIPRDELKKFNHYEKLKN